MFLASLLCNLPFGSKGGAVVRALTSQQCGPASNPGVDAICGLSLLLVSLLCPERFFSGYSGFHLSLKNNISKCYLSLFRYLLTYLFTKDPFYSIMLYYIWLLHSFSVPLFSFSLYNLQSPSNSCLTGIKDITNPHSRIPACTAEVFFGQGTGQSQIRNTTKTPPLSSGQKICGNVFLY